MKTFEGQKAASFSNLLRIPIRSLRSFHGDLTQTLPPDLFKNKIMEAEEALSDAVTAQVIYLPTYRRIEKELQTIFPQIDENLKRYTTERETPIMGRRGIILWNLSVLECRI